MKEKIGNNFHKVKEYGKDFLNFKNKSGNSLKKNLSKKDLLKKEVRDIRKDFSILSKEVRGYPLIYFDSAATTLKPDSVIESMNKFYSSHVSNVHRGAHYLSDQATHQYEMAREKVKKFICAKENEEIIFTSGTTESIQIVARSYVSYFLKPGQEILLTEMEHHSNIVPWQLVAKEKGFKIKVIPLNKRGELDLKAFSSLLNEKTGFVSLTWVSNVLGTVNPIKSIVEKAHAVGAKVLVDGAQGVGNLPTDVRAWDIDFLAFSGHKMFGPFGIGVLYGKRELLESMVPFKGGGGSIETVSFEETKFLPSPYKFEAGTPPVAEAIGLAKAIEYIESIQFQNILDKERFLIQYSIEILSHFPNLRWIGTSDTKFNISSFILEDQHSLDLGTFLDQKGIAIRTGHHCAEPLIRKFKANRGGVLRLSFSVYNTKEELDFFKDSLIEAKKFLTR